MRSSCEAYLRCTAFDPKLLILECQTEGRVGWPLNFGEKISDCYGQGMSKSRSISQLAADLQRWLHDWVSRNPEGAAKIALWAEERMEQPGDAGSLADLAKSFMDGLVPRNWWPLQIGMHQQAKSVMAESGICLVWVPPAEVVESIVRAPNKEERDAVLLANAETILDSVNQMLAETIHPQLDATTAAAREALATYRAGYEKAAQSLSAAILSEIVEGHFGFGRFSSARRAFESEPAGDAGLWSFRRVTVQAAIHAAILRSEEQSPEAGFNRHLSVHGVNARQFTPAHALAALMLVVGALRELHEIYRVAERGFGPSPRLNQHARTELQRRIPAITKDTVGPGVVRGDIRLN